VLDLCTNSLQEAGEMQKAEKRKECVSAAVDIDGDEG